MRHPDQEIADRAAIDAIINNSLACRLAMIDGDNPYIVPMCFGYDGNHLYFHSSIAGTKIEALKKNDKVCFEFESDVELQTSDQACNFGVTYQSVVGFGRAAFVTDPDEKKAALGVIVKQYEERSFEYPEKMLAATAVIKVSIDKITGKHSS